MPLSVSKATTTELELSLALRLWPKLILKGMARE
jgi:hypothetical protein